MISRFNRADEILDRATDIKLHLYTFEDGFHGTFEIQGLLDKPRDSNGKGVDFRFIGELLAAFRKAGGQ